MISHEHRDPRLDGVTMPPFQTLLDDHGRDVHRFLVACVGHHEAEDCYQETWLAALRAYPRLRDASNLRGWVLTIAHRKAIDHIRRHRRAPLPLAALPEPGGREEHSADRSRWAAVGALPPKQRAAVALRYGLDAEYATIAEAMGTSQDAARRNVHEGLRRLRRELRGSTNGGGGW
jgi:RNA polymerase sigma factor (sigma-70 family)